MYTEFNSDKIYNSSDNEVEKQSKPLMFISKILLILIIIIFLFLLLIKFEVISLASSIAPTAILLNQNEIGIKLGNSYQLVSTVLPMNAKNKQVVWESSDPSIVYVNQVTGYIEALKVGSAVIKAKTLINDVVNECLVNVTNDNILISNISVNQKHVNLAVGYSSSISYQISPPNANVLALNFTSSDTSVLTVSESGMITGIKEGSAVVTVSSNNLKSDNIYVTVYKKGSNNIVNGESLKTEYYPKNLSLENINLDLKIGGTGQLITKVEPSNANQIISWTSSNSSIASVSENGIVKANGIGIATIIGTTINGLHTICKVSVGNYAINLRNIDINSDNLTLKVNDTKQLEVNFTPSNASDKTTFWSSTNEEVVSVNESGVIKAVGKGNATIIVTSKDGKHQDKVEVEVLESGNYITENSINFSHSSYTVAIGSTINLNPIITPSNITFKNITFKSYDKNIATVDKNGVVKGISEGETMVTATTHTGLKATARVNVKNIKPTGVILNKTNLVLDKGATYPLIANLVPSNASNKNILYKSDNLDIIKIDSNGIITALKKGVATITVTPLGGGNPSTCLVEVK